MRVLIYIPKVDRSSGGIYQYTLALLKLLMLDNTNQYFVFSALDNPDLKSLEGENSNLFCLQPERCSDSVARFRANRFLNFLFLKVFSTRCDWLIPLSIHKVLKKYRINIVHCPYDDYPPNISVPGITTIHDLQELHFPEYFSPSQRVSRAIQKKRIIESASFIISSYDHVKSDIETFFPEASGKVKTALLRMDFLWLHKYLDKGLQDNSTEEQETQFILYPAATWAHKNHKALLNVFSSLRKSFPSLRLVCTGHKTSFYYDEIEPLLFELDLERVVEFKGVVADEDLVELYKTCRAVVVPTKYEAGSFPLMEAILLGVPVVCSNVTSLPETIRNMEFTFDPDDFFEMEEKLTLIINDEDFRLRNLQNTEQAKKNLVSNNALDTFLKVYQSLH